jgi:hypothetical protein
MDQLIGLCKLNSWAIVDSLFTIYSFPCVNVTTLGEAWKLGWRIRVHRLLVGRKPKSRDRKSIWCDMTTELERTA